MNERESRLEFLKAFLAERDLPCPLCGYNLRALTSEKCPECGSEVEVTVGLTEPRMAAFIAGVVGLAAGVGFNSLMLLWVAWMWNVQGRRSPRLDEVWTLFLGWIVTAAALALWLQYRRAIRLVAPSRRWGLATTCFVVSVALALLFFASVR